jgi:hypothetical protein
MVFALHVDAVARAAGRGVRRIVGHGKHPQLLRRQTRQHLGRQDRGQLRRGNEVQPLFEFG